MHLVDPEGLRRRLEPGGGALGTEWERRVDPLRATRLERLRCFAKEGLREQDAAV